LTPTVLGENPVDAHPGHDEDPGFLALLGQPGVELGAQHGHGIDRVGKPGVLVVDPDRTPGVEEVDVVAGDPTLDGSLVEEVREDLLHPAAVQHAAGEVLRARSLAPLDQDDGASLLGELIGGDAAGDAGPDHDDVEVVLGLGLGRI